MHPRPADAVRLVDLPIGGTGAVVSIDATNVFRVNKLAAYGIVPGSRVRLVARRPSVVIACGQTSLAIEDEIGRQIYVVPAT